MIVYLDTSSWVKLFVDESGSGKVRQIIGNCTAVCTHLITYVEIHAAFARARRMHRLTDASLQTAINHFELEWQHTIVVSVDEPLVRRAASLALSYKLRGYDSVHLAAAEILKKQSVARLAFTSFDDELNSAARALGMKIIA